MRYWITTQWPPTTIDDEDWQPNAVFVPDGREHHARSMKPGDLVVIYQSKTGRDYFQEDPDSGAKVRIRHKLGRQGVVALAQVIGTLRENKKVVPEKYVDGSEILWRWFAPIVNRNTAGFVDRSTLNHHLGYASNYGFRGFGTAKSGLMEINKHTYEKIVKSFIENTPPHALPKDMDGIYHGGGNGGESLEHYRLKCSLFHYPVEVLGVPCGTKGYKTEVKFRTGDRIDVTLIDPIGGLIAAEVEVEMGQNQTEGLLQAIKYKYMLAVQTEREFTEIAAYLVAYKIDNKIKQLCNKYDVSWFEVDVETVDQYFQDC
ncbi:MAG: EVE domain-containing protein [Candidatus Hatepunaea meridiana]|nr:EVE domain-containing protein [Candidatus Hatepunaea meridiana]